MVSNRPTPEQIAAAPGDGFSFLDRLDEHGYVIVHPDDLRAMKEAIIRATWNLGRPAAPRRAEALIDAIIADAEQETPI